MRQILYLNQNHSLKTVIFNGLNAFFPEKAFILSVVWDNVVISSSLAGLTALEKYAMQNPQFDALVLVESDFRAENTSFYMPDEYENGIPSSAGLLNISIPAMCPVFNNSLQSTPNNVLAIFYNETTDLHNVSDMGNTQLTNYCFGQVSNEPMAYQESQIVILGGLYFFFEKFLLPNTYVYVNPKTNEFCFDDSYYWVEITSPDISNYAIGKGYIRQFRNTLSNGNLLVSTTPIDSFAVFST